MREELLKILGSELKPALGCTGPIGVCFCAAQAYDAIGGEIKRILVKTDWGIGCKIDDVSFPGTQMLGAEMAVALGAVCGDPKAGLEVLKKVTPECELKARKVAELVTIEPQWDREDLGIFIDITIETDLGIGRAVTQVTSDGLTRKERNGEVIFESEPLPSAQSDASPILKYKLKDFYDFATTCPIDKLDIIRKSIEYNTALANEALEKNLGAGIGYYLYHNSKGDPIRRAKAWAAAGCEARMSGVNLPAMSCGNKGNVGIASTLPLISLAKDFNIDEEDLIRAIALSSLVGVAVIHRIGKSPSMCSCEVAASLGIAAGVVLLNKGNCEQAEIAIQHTIPNVFGVVCDGAKLSCALRISSGTGIAIESADLALAGVRLAFNQGVVSTSADASIDLLGKIALYGMLESDRELCREIFSKRKIFPLMSFSERQKQ